MSAASQQMGLAQSQDHIPFNKDMAKWEDPARAWIDLVAAFKAGNADQVRSILAIAKASHWTQDDWTEATAEPSDTEDYDDGGPEGDLYTAGQDDDFFNDM